MRCSCEGQFRPPHRHEPGLVAPFHRVFQLVVVDQIQVLSHGRVAYGMWLVKVQVGGAMPRGQDWREGRQQIKVWRAACRVLQVPRAVHCQDNDHGKPADNLSHAHHEGNRQGHAPVDVGTGSGGLTGRARQQAS